MENLEVICRVCLKIYGDDSANLTSIFEQSDELDIVEKIFLLSGILIIFDEERLMPRKICYSCVNSLNNAYTLRELIIKSDKFLQEINAVEFNKEEENERKEENSLIEEDEFYIEEEFINVPDEKPKNISKKRINPREPCFKCAKLISKKNMNLHLKTHSDVTKNYICDQCGKAFRMKSYLFSHMENQHISKKKFQCHCGKAYNKRNTYESHLNIHTGINLDSFKCEICEKSFAKRSRLKVHLRIHDDSRQFKCDFEGCSRTFKHKTDLRRHQMAQHTLQRPYKCTKCDKGFVKNSQLQSHSKRCSKII